MLETLRCPSCSTRFGLRADRVHARIRRAQCFRCDTVFGIEEAVAHLLAPALESLEAAEPPPAEPCLEVADPNPEPEPAATMDFPPSLSLGDLEGADDAPYQNPGSNYASAKDAIAKLMGAAPNAPTPPRLLASRGSMDVEATLNALDTTLGGSAAAAPAPAPSSMASTLKLSAQEIQAALAASGQAKPALPPPARVEPPQAVTHSHPALAASLAQDPNLLKVQLEQETCNNVTTEQMAAWIEQGRVHEYHMVARQFSDNWIEASKVPALRPIFDQRKRRQAPAAEDMPIPPAEILPAKKGLFGGLFGRN